MLVELVVMDKKFIWIGLGLVFLIGASFVSNMFMQPAQLNCPAFGKVKMCNYETSEAQMVRWYGCEQEEVAQMKDKGWSECNQTEFNKLNST